MSGQNDKKLNLLLAYKPGDVIFCSKWLEERGYYRQLIKKYVDSGWLTKVGQGAFVRLNESVDWTGVVYSLQKQLHLPVHVGGLTALEFYGLVQYLVLNKSKEQIHLFNTGQTKFKLPQWLVSNYQNFLYVQRYLFVTQFDLVTENIKGKEILISTPERAILELLELVPKAFSFEYASELVENLHLLRPNHMQKLLEVCNSVKVKRLFIYLAEKYNLPVFSHLKLKSIDLGKGKRVIGEGGLYIPKYKISVPIIAQQEDEEGIGNV